MQPMNGGWHDARYGSRCGATDRDANRSTRLLVTKLAKRLSLLSRLLQKMPDAATQSSRQLCPVPAPSGLVCSFKLAGHAAR